MIPYALRLIRDSNFEIRDSKFDTQITNHIACNKILYQSKELLLNCSHVLSNSRIFPQLFFSHKASERWKTYFFIFYIAQYHFLLAHLYQRSMWAIAITMRPSSSVVVNFLEKSSSQKLLMLQTWNFTTIIYRVSRW